MISTTTRSERINISLCHKSVFVLNKVESRTLISANLLPELLNRYGVLRHAMWERTVWVFYKLACITLSRQFGLC